MVDDARSVRRLGEPSAFGGAASGATGSALAVGTAVPRARFANWRHLVASPIRVAAAAIAAVLVAGAILAPVVSPYDPLEIDIKSRLAGPSGEHLLGTDEL